MGPQQGGSSVFQHRGPPLVAPQPGYQQTPYNGFPQYPPYQQQQGNYYGPPQQGYPYASNPGFAPPQPQPNAGQPVPNANKVLPNSVKKEPASKNVKQTSPKEVKKGPTVSPANIIGTRDESLIDESIKQTLLKGLNADDFIMETPSAAIFTLVVGTLVAALLFVSLALKCRQLRKRGRKRNVD